MLNNSEEIFFANKLMRPQEKSNKLQIIKQEPVEAQIFKMPQTQPENKNNKQ